MVAEHESVERLREIADEVEAVGDLDGVWRPEPGALGVCTPAVAGDELDPGVGAEPRRERPRFAVGQEVDDGVALEIDEESAVLTCSPTLSHAE